MKYHKTYHSARYCINIVPEHLSKVKLTERGRQDHSQTLGERTLFRQGNPDRMNYKSSRPYHLIVSDSWFELQEKILVFRIILGLLDLRASKRLNGLPGLPKRQCEKMGLLPLDSSQDIHTSIPFCTFIVGDRSL